MGNKRIRAMTQDDVRHVARLHGRLLPGLLTDLGPSVTRFFYSSALDVQGARGWILQDNDLGVVGFAFACDQGAGLYARAAKRHPLRGLIALFAGLFTNPEGLLRAFLWFAKERPRGDEFSGAELIYLAVDPAGRGGGSAALLVKEASESFRARSIKAFHLSVAEDNQSVQRFFESLGAVVLGPYEEGGIRRKRLAFRYED